MRHLTHVLRGLGALTVLVVFTVGVPVGLTAYVGWPLPTALPTLDEIQLAVRSGIDPQLVINTLAVTVWLTWTQLVAALATEAFAAARGKTAPRLPVLAGLQPAVAHLVAAITLAVAAIGPLRVAPAAAAPLHTHVVAPVHPTPELGHQPAETATQLRNVPDRGGPVGSAEATWPVGRFDTLWQVAESTLGDGRRWQEIRDLNIGRTMPDGHRFTHTTDRLTPGWLLILPDGAHTPEQTDPTHDPQDENLAEVTVEPGDNFWTIAQETLHTAWGRAPSDGETAGYWRHVVDVNRHRLAPRHDPDLIYPDQRFELPPIPTDPNTDQSTVSPATDTSTSRDVDGVTVEQGDSFWSIAHDTLAEAWQRTPSSVETAGYWHQVVDLNRDRLLPPHDPDLIYPKQRFELPPVPNDPQTPGSSAIDLETRASSQGPADEPRTEPGTVPEPPTFDASPATTAPNRITAVPPVAAEPVSPPATPASPTPTEPINSQQVPESKGQAPGTGSGGDADGGNLAGELLPVVSTVAGLGILAAGLVALLRRLRATQLRHRRPGTVPTPPPPDTAGTEATLRTAAAPTATEFLDLALRAMAHNITTNHIPPPEVVGVYLSSDTLRLLLGTPHHDPPSGWRVDDDARSWTLRTDTDIDQLRNTADAVPAPYPALVTVGHEDHAQLLLDLEHLGATQLTGDPGDVAATCYTMATELAASPLADGIQIICVGFGDDLAQLERIRVVEHLAEALPAVEAKAAAVTHHASTTPLHGRVSGPGGDSWDPIVVFDPSPTPPDQASRLLATAHTGRGVAAVVGYPAGDRWRFHIENTTIRVEPLGYTLARRNLTPTEQTAVAELITAAKDHQGEPTGLHTEPVGLNEQVVLNEPSDEAPAPSEEPVDEAPAPSEEPVEEAEEHVTEAGRTPIPEVKVLGTLRIDGLNSRFPYRRSGELVTYLTFHRNGVEADTLMEALWPEEPPDYSRLNRHMSRTRTTLGYGPDGAPYLCYISNGIYRISSHLHNDLELFARHIGQADQASGTEQIKHLRAALELVEGTPFTGAGNAYTWAHIDGTITHAIVTIDNAAHRLGQLALGNDTPDLATWAARRGLIATGACEECHRNLMRAAIAEDNQVALEATYSELLAVVDADEGPDASTYLDPETIELYEQHTRKRRRRAG